MDSQEIISKEDLDLTTMSIATNTKEEIKEKIKEGSNP